MKRVITKKRIVLSILLLIAIVAVAMGILIGRKQRKKKDAIPVSIRVDEDYAINDADDLKTSFKSTFKSEDSSVATLRYGKYILGLRVGNTKITVNDGKKDMTYDVTVTAGKKTQSRSTPLMVEDTEQKNKIQMGYGYNALTGKEVNAYSLTKPIFDWDKVVSSGELYMDESEQVDTKTYIGSSIQDFTESYSEKLSLRVCVKLFGIKVLDKQKVSQQFSKKQEGQMKDMKQLYQQIVKRSYDFTEDVDGYEDYLLPEVKKKLMGTDQKKTTPKEFIEEYGTHVLVSGLYGGSFELNYFSTGEKSQQELFGNSNEFIFSNSVIRECAAKYAREHPEEFKSKKDYQNAIDIVKKSPTILNATIYGSPAWWTKPSGGRREEQFWDTCKRWNDKHLLNTSRRMIGAETVKRSELKNRMRAMTLVLPQWTPGAYEYGKSLNMIVYDYAYWVEKLEGDVLIGLKNKNSLYPVWEMIPTDTEEGRTRLKEFEKYLSSLC